MERKKGTSRVGGGVPISQQLESAGTMMRVLPRGPVREMNDKHRIRGPCTQAILIQVYQDQAIAPGNSRGRGDEHDTLLETEVQAGVPKMQLTQIQTPYPMVLPEPLGMIPEHRASPALRRKP